MAVANTVRLGERMREDTLGESGLAGTIREFLERRPEIVFAYLHGSVARGERSRDIDVAVWVDEARTANRGPAVYAADLETALQASLRRPVDVQVLNRAPLAFRYHALRGTPILVRDWEFLDELRARTWDEYFDFRPLARQYLREVLSA
jgi:predicted nucleotidyltransferase